MSKLKKTHADYDAAQRKRQRCRDAIGGQDDVYAAKTAYLPALKGQNEDDYNAMQQRGTFYNATRRTLHAMAGMLFRTRPDVISPTGLQHIIDDVTLGGVSLIEFSEKVIFEILSVGRVGVMVDHPPAPGNAPITLSSVAALNLRPLLQMYKAEDILDWRFTVINNRRVLSFVKLHEQRENITDEMTVTYSSQYRVLDLAGGIYRVRVFEINKKGEDVLLSQSFPEMSGSAMNFIPFEIIDFMEPPLLALVDMNLSHWRSTVDYEHGCHFSALPTAVISGYNPIKSDEIIPIGGSAFITLPDPSSKAYFMEMTGDMSALKANIDRKEQHMAVLGARMLEQQKRVAESIDSMGMHRAGEDAVLSGISHYASIALTRALKWLSEWAGVNGDVSITFNTDFVPEQISPAEMTALLAAYQAGAMSLETLFWNFKQGERYPAGDTFEGEQARIANSAPQLAPGV